MCRNGVGRRDRVGVRRRTYWVVVEGSEEPTALCAPRRDWSRRLPGQSHSQVSSETREVSEVQGRIGVPGCVRRDSRGDEGGDGGRRESDPETDTDVTGPDDDGDSLRE